MTDLKEQNLKEQNLKEQNLKEHSLNQLTLKQIMDRVDTLHNLAFNLTLTMPMKRLTAATLELQTYIKALQVIAQHTAQISNFITRIIHRKNQADITTPIIDLIPRPGDYAILNILQQPIPWQTTQQIPFVNIQHMDDIPISYVYCINQTNQPLCQPLCQPIKTAEQFKNEDNKNEDNKHYLAVNINGYIINGLPGRIGYGLPQSVMCKVAKCKTQNCPYWHSNYNSNVHLNDVPLVRNFTPDAWKTTHYKSKAGTQRVVGSVDTLNYDIQELTPHELDAEINLRKSQLIHDIYVFLTLCNFKKPKNIC
jgi:hypothetical protein